MDIRALVRELQNEHGLSRSAAEELALKSLEVAQKKKQVGARVAKRRATNYWDFLSTSSPDMDWDNPLSRYLAGVVDQIVAHQLLNVTISISPRAGKSELLTKRLPVYWLEANPRDKVIVGAYNQTLARSFTYAALKLYRERNPDDLDLEAQDEWTTAHGGSVLAVGVGSGVTGRGGNLILIDDPVKSVEEAFSKAYRERVWNWFLSDLRTRRNVLGRTPMIVIATRWHTDDLIGKIHQNSEPGEWVDICIPGIAEEHDILGRQPGESINPTRLPIAELQREKRLMGPRFDALYQGKPINESGALFNIEKFGAPIDAAPILAHRVRFWDRAASAGSGDWTVGALVAYDSDGIAYIEDVIRERLTADAVRVRMKQTLITDLEKYGNIRGYTYKCYFEREPGGDGKTAADDITRSMAPYPIYSDRPTDNKTARSAGYAVAVNAGNIRLIKGSWVKELLDEHVRFMPDTDNKHDDIVDACAGAFNKLAIENAIVTVR